MKTNKVRMTRPKVYNLNGRDKVINVSNGNLQYLLRYFDRVGYNYNVEGWTYDVYDLVGYTFVTGRRAIGNIPNYDLTEKYKELGKELSNLRDWTEKKDRALELLEEFVKELEK